MQNHRSILPPTFIIIQARLSSSRFPGKVMQDLCGKPMLIQQIKRASHAKNITKIIVATSNESSDDTLFQQLTQENIVVFRGSINNVLKRFYDAACWAIDTLSPSHRGAVRLVRLTGDCPLIDPQLIDRSLSMLSEDIDYVGYDSSLPDGLDVESFWFSTLERALKEAQRPSELEHVTPYIWNHPEKFQLTKIIAKPIDPDLSKIRLSVDRKEDLELVRKIFNEGLQSKNKIFGLADIASILNDHKDCLQSNSVRNEGYIKSIREDQLQELPKRNLTQSFSLWERAKSKIPSGTQTLSKGPDQFIRGVYPVFLERGQGPYVWDVDGNKYIDYPMALGAILLGHAHPKVIEAVSTQIKDSTVFTLMHPLEVHLAEKICELVPCAQKVRFGKNGADANAGAIRCARALTGRDHIAYCGYHGYQDWYAAIHPRSKGVPKILAQFMHEFTYNDIASLEKVFRENPSQIACVIMEQPVIEPKDGFLQKCLDLAHQHGALFILDEIVTGFRYAKGGAQEFYGIKPDMACIGKAMANGFPISAIVGQAHVMQEFENIFFSTTFGGETASMAAALAVLDAVKNDGVIEYIWDLGNYWIQGFNEIKTAVGGVDVKLLGCAPRTVFEFRDSSGAISNDIRSLFLQETCKRGILFGVPIFMTFSHTRSDIDQTLSACQEALKIGKKAIEDDNIDAFMEGEKVGMLFRPQPKS